MQEPFRLIRQILGPLPILDRFIERIGLPEHLTEATRRAPYARALLLLLRRRAPNSHVGRARREPWPRSWMAVTC
jgi:hypothetical protein